MMQAGTARTAPLVNVHTLAFFDPATGRLAVSDGAGGMWVRDSGGRWESAHNGDGGLLFFPDAEATAWEPEFGVNAEALVRYLGLFMFSDYPLSRDDQRILFSVWLLSQFFPALRRTRMILACLGPQGSGKSTALRLTGALFLGQRFEVTKLQREREDAFVAAVTNRAMVGLDNADSRVPWLEDSLATYATGLRYQLRRLYTTNDEMSYEPRAVLMLSSRDPQFNRPDVAEWLLPLHFERPERYQAEEGIFRELAALRGASSVTKYSPRANASCVNRRLPINTTARVTARFPVHVLERAIIVDTFLPHQPADYLSTGTRSCWWETHTQ